MIFYLPDSEKKNCRTLYETVFTEDSKSFIDYYFQEQIQNNQVLTFFENGEIVSMLHLSPHFLQVKKEVCVIPYIYAVSTLADHRKKGYMGRLMERALQDLYEKKVPFTYLIPVSPRVYEPYGFSFVSDKRSKEFLLEKMQSELSDVFPEKKPEFRLVIWNQLSKMEQAEELSHFLNQELQNVSSCFIFRDPDYFMRLMKQLELENGMISLLYKNEELAGYCFLDGANPRNVWELVCEPKNQSDFMRLLCETLGLKDIHVKNSLHESKSMGQPPFVMGRIVNLNQFANYICAKQDMELFIEIIDKKIAENSGVFLWKLDQEGSSFEKTHRPPQITMEIEELTSWLFGFLDTQKYQDIDIYDKLKKVKTLERIFINDEV